MLKTKKNVTIWIDFTNSPHVNFFENMVNEFQKNDDVLLTSRPLANTLDLIEMLGFQAQVVGKHYGRSAYKKVFGYFIRVVQLYKYLADKSADVAVSHSSFYSPAVSKLLKIPCIYLNDNEHAKGNYLALLFSDRVLVPEFMNISKMAPLNINIKKIKKYPGVKEGVYLWKLGEQIKEIKNSNGSSTQKTIYIRPEPWTAQYYKGKHNFLDDLLLDLKERYKIILLPRSKEQNNHYQSAKFKGVTIPKKSLMLTEIVKNCDLFLGAGGTMTREMAVIGIPTISIYQDELLEVDKFLISENCMIHNSKPTGDYVDSYLKDKLKSPPNKILMEKGKEAYHQIKETIMEYAKGEIDA